MPAFENESRLTFNALCGVALTAALFPACGGAPSNTAVGPTESGRVSLPLVTTVGDHRYRLSGVYIYIYGPVYAQIWSNGDGSEATLSARLPTGNFAAYLNSWRLERDDGSGAFWPVEATLISGGTANFTVSNGTTTTLSYEFQSDGVIVKIGSGTVKVAAKVDEIAAVCTPFGSDCEVGSWCPPTGLTGARRACVPAGTVALGMPCLSPLDCVANASCFDAGAGPVCAELCPASSFDAPCASGGSCQAADAEYGVCQ